MQTGWHALDAQLVVPCGLAQVVPQAPQLVAVLLRSVSQPFVALPSQLPKVPLQTGTQAPLAQLVVPCPLVQALPQDPQLATAVLRVTSQPVEANPSQLPKPPLHATEHEPAEHEAVPLVPLQTAPQEPQLEVFVFVFVSHPLAALLSQFPNPELQTGAHAPPEQLVVPFTFVQPFPQTPQSVIVVFVFVSQPFPALASQLPKPALQVPSVHTPDGHVSLALARLQPVLQSPQSVSVLMLRSQPLLGLPSQLLKLAEHVGTQDPAVHAVEPFVLVHAVPQAPQFAVLVPRFASQPGEASQLPNPPLHVREQDPRLHVALALAPLHTDPQEPQLPTLTSVFVSQPLFGFESQLLKVPLQTGVQTPAVQLVEPFELVHVVPQPPQLLESAAVLVSQPFLGLPSQSV